MNDYQKELLRKHPIKFLLFALGIGRRVFKKSKHEELTDGWWKDQGFVNKAEVLGVKNGKLVLGKGEER